jgi:hypothetical protein
VHDDRAGAGPPGECRDLRVALQAANVVDDGGSGAERREATGAFIVSIERSAPVSRSASTTGTTRCNSSASETGAASRRVDSPPMSRMAAPSRASILPCAAAVSGSRNRPPSEKESGVTFTMPMTIGVCPRPPARQAESSAAKPAPASPADPPSAAWFSPFAICDC